MKILANDIRHPSKCVRTETPAIRPKEIIPDAADWSREIINDWNSGHQIYYARSSFMKFCLPALVYSLIVNASQKILRFLPLGRRLCVSVERLDPKDCFAPELSSHGRKTPPIAIVTGSNTGVGFETASGLAERGYHVILACRSREKGRAAAERINDRLESLGDRNQSDRAEHHFALGGEATFLHPLDLSSFRSVRSFCEIFGEKYDSLNLLVNNAGINSQGDATEDGLEICFQSNFVGHFLLTNLLVDHLKRAENRYHVEKGLEGEAGRVVNLSSVTHHFAPANERASSDPDSSRNEPLNNGIHDKHFWLGSAMPGLSDVTYRESKLASILFTMEINKRFGAHGIRSIAVNPGSVSSDIWRNDSKMLRAVYKMVYLDPRQGSSTSVAGAIGSIPRDAIYLQPYWQPELKRQKQKPLASAHVSSFRWYGLPFPLTEMLGPYIGYAITEPRLPLDGNGGYESSGALWDVCEKIAFPG